MEENEKGMPKCIAELLPPATKEELIEMLKDAWDENQRIHDDRELLKIEASTAKVEQKRQFEEDQKVIEELKSKLSQREKPDGVFTRSDVRDQLEEIIRLQGKVKEAWRRERI